MERIYDNLVNLKALCEEMGVITFLNPVEVEKGTTPSDWFRQEDFIARVRQLKHFAEMNYHDSVMFGIRDLITDIESGKVKAPKNTVEILNKTLELVRESALAGKPWWQTVQEIFRKMIGEKSQKESKQKNSKGTQMVMVEDIESIGLEDMVRYFEFLDELKESDDEDSMLYASLYLRNEFGLDKETAQKVFELWVTTFGRGNEPAKERAKKALGGEK